MTAVQKDVSQLQEALQQLNERNEYADRSILVAVDGFLVGILTTGLCGDVIWYSWGVLRSFLNLFKRMGHDGPHAIPCLPPDSGAPKTDYRNEQITKKGEQIIELHRLS